MGSMMGLILWQLRLPGLMLPWCYALCDLFLTQILLYTMLIQSVQFRGKLLPKLLFR